MVCLKFSGSLLFIFNVLFSLTPFHYLILERWKAAYDLSVFCQASWGALLDLISPCKWSQPAPICWKCGELPDHWSPINQGAWLWGHTRGMQWLFHQKVFLIQILCNKQTPINRMRIPPLRVENQKDWEGWKLLWKTRYPWVQSHILPKLHKVALFIGHISVNLW